MTEQLSKRLQDILNGCPPSNQLDKKYENHMGWNDCFLHIIIVHLSYLSPKFSIVIGSLHAYLTRYLTYNKTLDRDWFSARLLVP